MEQSKLCILLCYVLFARKTPVTFLGGQQSQVTNNNTYALSFNYLCIFNYLANVWLTFSSVIAEVAAKYQFAVSLNLFVIQNSRVNK